MATLYIDATIEPFFGSGTLTTEITWRRIEQYAEHRIASEKGHGEGTVKRTTVNKELACIRQMKRKAEEWGCVAANPAARVRDLPDDGQAHDRFLAPDEYALMLLKAGNNLMLPWTLPGERFEDLAELVVIACHTGLRSAELLHLQFSDVNLERGMLSVRNKPQIGFHVKNYQERHIPLTAQAVAAFASTLAKKHPVSDFVFHRSDGSKWQTVGASFEALIDRCGTPLVPGWPLPAFRCARSRSLWATSP